MERKSLFRKPQITKEKVLKFIKTQVVDICIAILIYLTLVGYIPMQVLLVLAGIAIVRYVVRLVKRVKVNVSKEKA